MTVSPVFATARSRATAPLPGARRAGPLLAGAPPAYALGGVLPGHVEACLSVGAAGVAVMGPLMREPALAADYLAALGQET